MADLEHRRAVRAVLLTPQVQVLLMCAREPVSARRIWFTPGGGLDPGEDPVAGLRRELLEETGLDLPHIGPLIWTRHHEFDWAGRRISQVETYYYAPVERFEPLMLDNPSLGEAAAFQEFRWLTPHDIRALHDIVAPRPLADLIETLASEGPPHSPVEVAI